MNAGYESASILPHGYYNREEYYYFAVEKRGTLSTFGGKRDPGETHPQKTASREMFEESCGVSRNIKMGVFGSQANIQAVLSDFRNNGTKRIRNGDHVCYVAPFNTTRITKFTGNNEIKKIIAVRKQTLQEAIKQEKWKLQGYKVRKCAKETLRIAYRQGAI